MPEDGDRFAAFEEVEGSEESTDSDQDSEPESDAESEPEPDPEPEPEPEPPTSEESEPVTESKSEPTTDETESDPDDDAIEDPAFSYAESNQGPIYARPETWDEYKRTLSVEAEGMLWDRGVKDIQKRELHDAALRLVAENPERLVELAIEARREN